MNWKLFSKGMAAAFPLMLLTACTTLAPTAQQPKEGPRARVRLASFADELTVEVTQPDGKKGKLYTRSGFYPGESNLGMPKGSMGWPGRNEYYVIGDQVVVAHSEITRVPAGYTVVASHCEASGLIRIESGKDYEIGVVTGQGEKGWDMTSCAITAAELVSLPDGAVKLKPVLVVPLPGKSG